MPYPWVISMKCGLLYFDFLVLTHGTLSNPLVTLMKWRVAFRLFGPYLRHLATSVSPLFEMGCCISTFWSLFKAPFLFHPCCSHPIDLVSPCHNEMQWCRHFNRYAGYFHVKSDPRAMRSLKFSSHCFMETRLFNWPFQLSGVFNKPYWR